MRNQEGLGEVNQRYLIFGISTSVNEAIFQSPDTVGQVICVKESIQRNDWPLLKHAVFSRTSFCSFWKPADGAILVILCTLLVNSLPLA